MRAELRSLATQQFGCAAPETGDRSQVASNIPSAHSASHNSLLGMGTLGRSARAAGKRGHGNDQVTQVRGAGFASYDGARGWHSLYTQNISRRVVGHRGRSDNGIAS